MLDIQHISKTFNPGTVNEKKALTDLSLHLDPGDFVTIIGSNGAGKSTLFNAISGSFFTDSGSIFLDGQDVTFQPEYQRARHIGRLFQDPMRGSAPGMTIEENLSLAQNVVLMQNCCKRAFIRGAFLAAGSISDPEKFYHFEITCATEAKAKQIQGLILSMGIEAKIVLRKKYFVVYIKEGSQIVDILNVMEAPVALMELENIRILKEMRGSVNRQVNCETANINKTVSAAVKQMEDIIYIRDTAGFDSLPDNLREIAELRLARPEATLKELGEALDPPVGKSGVNHRLRKLGNMAERLRQERPDTGA